MPAMRTKEFLELLPDLLRQHLPEDLANFQVANRITSLTKFYYNQPSFHYEVWIQKRRKEVELGLHFESDPDSNLEQLDLLREKADQIHGSLGDEVELHEWDRGWTRAHETLELDPLDDDFLVEISFRLSAMIQTFEPILRGES